MRERIVVGKPRRDSSREAVQINAPPHIEYRVFSERREREIFEAIKRGSWRMALAALLFFQAGGVHGLSETWALLWPHSPPPPVTSIAAAPSDWHTLSNYFNDVIEEENTHLGHVRVVLNPTSDVVVLHKPDLYKAVRFDDEAYPYHPVRFDDGDPHLGN